MEQIAHEVLQLTPDQRAELINFIVESLESAQPDDIQHLWITEASRRLSEARSGNVKTIPGEEVLAEARHLIKR